MIATLGGGLGLTNPQLRSLFGAGAQETFTLPDFSASSAIARRLAELRAQIAAAQGKPAADRRALPRPEPDRRVPASEAEVTGRTSGEKRTGEPWESFLAELKAFAVKPAGVAVIGLFAILGGLAVYHRFKMGRR